MDETKILEIENAVHRLSLEEGNKWNADSGMGAIASLSVGRKSWYMVFAPRLPKGRKPEGDVRLRVRALRDPAGKLRTDRGGRPLFQGSPTAVEYEDRWRDNGDGTLSRVTCSINWLLEEREEGTCETRPSAQREVYQVDLPAWRFVWGKSPAASFLERVITKVFALEIESVQHGRLGWTKNGERREPQPTELFAISGWQLTGGSWYGLKLQVTHAADSIVQFSVKYAENGQERTQNLSDTWANIPTWLQTELSAPYPVCGCGRQRADLQRTGEQCSVCGSYRGHVDGCCEAPDGYQRCELCRNEETCDRCGQEPRRINLIRGRRVCAACEAMTLLEVLVEQRVSADFRQQIAAEARRLLAGQALEQELGEMVLASTMDHFTHDARARASLLQDWSGYAWYYVCDDGMFASKFSPEALRLLQHYDRASGDGLVMMTAWIASLEGKVSACERLDFYWRTQVKGEAIRPTAANVPTSTAYSLAVNLRGSEQDRQAALRRFRSLVVATGDHSRAVHQVRAVLLGQEQDYATALVILDAIEADQLQQAAEEACIAAAEKSGHLVRKLEVNCDTRYGRGHVWVIRPDGTVREHDSYGNGGRRRYTCYAWNMISDELVIVHDASVSGVDFSGSTGIVWRPQQVTPAQIATVERLEGENWLGGTFEVDPSLVAKRAKMMDEIRKEILRVSSEENVQDLKFLNVSSADGYQMRHDNPRRLVNWAIPFSASCEGRDAQVVKAVRCADGMVEFLAYEKWGTTNLNVRWRPLTDEEKAASQPKPAAPKAEAKPASAEQVTNSLAALQAKFGGNKKH